MYLSKSDEFIISGSETKETVDVSTVVCVLVSRMHMVLLPSDGIIMCKNKLKLSHTNKNIFLQY